MKHTPERHRNAADRTVKDIRRKTRKRYSSEDKIRIVLTDLGGQDTITELYRQEGTCATWRICKLMCVSCNNIRLHSFSTHLK